MIECFALRNVVTKCHCIMSEPIYQNRKDCKKSRLYSFFYVTKAAKILNKLNSADFVRLQTVICFKRILATFFTKMNKANLTRFQIE